MRMGHSVVFDTRSREDRVEEACARIWRMRQRHGIATVVFDWHESGSLPGDPVCTVAVLSED